MKGKQAIQDTAENDSHSDNMALKKILADVINEYKDVDFGVKIVDCIRLKKSVLHREGPTYSTVREVKFKE